MLTTRRSILASWSVIISAAMSSIAAVAQVVVLSDTLKTAIHKHLSRTLS